MWFDKEEFENYQTMEEREDSESADSLSCLSEKFPEAFVEAIRHRSSFHSDGNRPTSSSECESSCTDRSGSSKVSLATKIQKKATMIPASVLAALNTIQRSQLRRVREEASVNLEDILRNVVKTVDQYYVDHYPREVLVPAKHMIGSDAQENEEKRIKAEIKKILKGDVMQQLEHASLLKTSRRRDAVSLTQKQIEATEQEEDDGMNKEEEEGEEENIPGVTHVVGEPEVPVCQVMLNIIDELNEISDQRESILNEVLQWAEGYPPDSFLNFPLSFEEEDAEPIENIFENTKIMEGWCVNKNIRRLSVLSEEMGLIQIEDVEKREGEGDGEEKMENKRRKLLEEKMNKQRSKYISTKVFDAETLAEPKNWQMAARAIVQIFDEAASSSNNARTKQMYVNAQKQFRSMTTLAEKRLEEKTKLGLQVNDLSGKLTKEKKETKSLRKKKHILETQMEKQEDEIVELKKEMEVKDKTIAEQTTQIYELEIMNEEMNRKQENMIYAQAPQPAQQTPAPIATTEVPVPNKTSTTEKESAPPPNKTVKPKAAKQPKARPVQVGQGGKPRKETKEGEKRSKQEKDEPTKSSVIMSLKEAKAELEEIRKAGEARESQIKELKMKVASEAEKFEQEKAKLEEEIQFHKMQTDGAKKQLELEQATWDQVKNEMTQEKDRLTNEVQAKEEIINYQEQRIQEVAREMTLSLMRAGLQTSTSTGRGDATDRLLESKQMLAKLHLQYEYEMQKLRAFVNRETERHLADMRRLELDHKRDLNIIYRDTSVIFRAVNRFKECLAVLLDREGLEDAAFGIRNIPNLFEDETVTDAHVRLARMAGCVTELMIQMEFKMSQALMNKRMEIKDNSLAKTFLSKDLETREELLKKARELGNLQAEKLKQVREELSSQEVEFLKLKHSEEDKHFDMAERNKDLTKQNQVLNKDLTALQNKFQEETTKKEEHEQEMEKIKMAMKKTIEQQEVIIANLQAENMRIIGEQKLNLKKSDMMRNIKLLNDALAARKISEEKHTVAMTMIDKTMEVSGLRFVHFVRKYVLQRSWKKICEAMKAFHKSNKRPPKVEKFLKNMEKRMEEKKQRWQERKAELLKTRTELYMHFRNMCNELNKEDGVYLIRPTVQKVHSVQSVQQGSDQECLINRKQKLSKNIPRKANVGIGRIAEVKGFQFFAPNMSHQTSWEFPLIQTTQSSIVTPKILDMEINKARDSCQRVLTSKSCGNFKDGGLGVKNLPWYQRQKARDTLFSLPPIASLYPED